MPFAYYENLSAKDKLTYRKSDKITEVPVAVGPDLRRAVAELGAALAAENRRQAQRAASHLCRALTAALEVPRVKVTVRAFRPTHRDGSETHGQYTWEEGETPIIEVWMRTARHGRVVAFKTFLRTVIHEVCHHLDLYRYGLDKTFHTEGFFRRESSLVRQLTNALPSKPPAKGAAKGPGKAEQPAKAEKKQQPKKGQPRQPEAPGGSKQSGQTELPF